MKISGSNVVPFPVAKVWDALLDPRVLVATIPGCEKLESTVENEYAMTVTAGVAAIKGTYAGTCTLSDLKDHDSLVMKLTVSGAPGTIDATVDVAFDDLGAEGTRISYEADAVVGGMVGGVGQRMLSSVSKRMAAEFFGNIGNAIAQPAAPATVAEQGAEPVAGPAASTRPANPVVFTAPAGRTGGAGSQDDLLKGVGIGAGLVLLGAIVGSALTRRR
ncbi:SRPBCC family protein [Pseudonocardia acidicola]|uniref:Carbon monoxide dehydrogenase subunit G n=1 Tax=Pseudonocardia acidicola TaxID=2724939 RepID=A0ABX1S8F1_9PSEU|nr:carbon monoxide dehydrogenase subunit G [Pseudonocardia acidicola]NMH97838.1 carbon monoxide dehydrogenase subunit G [Pseudonocardia acidicola]